MTGARKNVGHIYIYKKKRRGIIIIRVINREFVSITKGSCVCVCTRRIKEIITALRNVTGLHARVFS